MDEHEISGDPRKATVGIPRPTLVPLEQMPRMQTSLPPQPSEPVAPVEDEPMAVEETEYEESETDVEGDSNAAIDYKALYEENKLKMQKAEYTLYKRDKEAREAKKKEQIETRGFTDPQETQKEIEEQVNALFRAQREREAEDTIQEELFNLCPTEDERNLVRFIYDNSIVKTGFSRASIRQNLEDSKFLANKPKYLKEKTELVQTAISKKTMSNSGEGTGSPRPKQKQDLSKQFSAQDWKFMQDRGWSDRQIREALANKQT